MILKVQALIMKVILADLMINNNLMNIILKDMTIEIRIVFKNIHRFRLDIRMADWIVIEIKERRMNIAVII